MSTEGAGGVEIFELELPLPDPKIADVAKRLVGFESRYERIRRDLMVSADPEALRVWSKQFHQRELPLCAAVSDRYPLMIFTGDVGTGKTVAAEAACDRLARETRQEAMLFKLSTRVRGVGKVGQMTSLLNEAFEVVARQAGKKRNSFLIIDEADSLTAARENSQSHHEDKVAVNTIIQKVDDLRRLGGRVLVFLCTNRASALDPAVVRRAMRVELFERPTASEREELFRMDLAGLAIGNDAFEQLVALTGSHDGQPGFTFSDLRSRMLPAALGRAFPDRALRADDLLDAAREVRPSPAITGQ
jgi:AAA+ superfamily predicted ATPase